MIRIMLLMGSLLVLTLSWLFSLPLNARYPDLILERAYYADPESREDIQSIQSREFTPFNGPLFRGNDLRPLWLRLKIGPSVHSNWVLMYQPNYIHQVETWLPQPDGDWKLVVVGSRHPYNQRVVKTLVPAVLVKPATDRSITIYARVKTPSTPVFVRVLTKTNSAAFDSLLHMIAGAFLGIGLILSLLSFLVYINTRDKLWGVDALLNLVGMLVMSLQLGLVSRLFFPDSTNVVNQLSMIANCGYVFMAAIMHRTLYGVFSLPRWMYLPNTAILFMFAVQLLLIGCGKGDLAMAINNSMILFTSLFGLIVVLKIRHTDVLMLWGFRMACLVFLVFTIWWGVPIVFQIQTGNLSTLYPNLPASLFNMLILLLIVLRNTQLKARAARRLALEKRVAERKLRESRRRHEETNSFLGMLLHEVKNPLSTIRMTVSNLQTALKDQDETVQRRLRRVHESVNNIDGVLERGVEVDSLEQGALVLDIAQLDVVELVANFCATHTNAARFVTTLPAELIGRIDSHLLSLMLRNLVDNAIKYSPDDSLVEIHLSSDDAHWRLEVCSVAGAVGFPDPERVFKKYYRSPLAMRCSGMGLGLYWVRGVARQMGGDAYYAREQDKVVFGLCLRT